MKNFRITLQGQVHDVSVELLDEPESAPAPVAAPVAVSAASAASAAPVAPPRPATAGGSGEVRSPLAGKLVSVDVRPGQRVAEGDQVATIEAMKMNTYVFAPRAGTVASVTAVPGEGVEENETLLVID